MRLLVCGGRDFEDWDLFKDSMTELVKDVDHVIISGRAKGADTMAQAWAKYRGYQFEGYLADWEAYGKAAGHMRNKRMLDEGHPDLVIAFPGGKGTANMVEQATKAGVKVINVRHR